MTSQQDIHQTVQARYGAIATGGGSCCGGTSNNVTLYDAGLVADLPVDVTGLSLGCGGIDYFLAAKQVGAAGYVIGVDMTPAMLEKANANKVKMGVNSVEFRRGTSKRCRWSITASM